MEKTLKLTFQKGDILAVILVIMIAALTGAVFFMGLNQSSHAVVQIWQDGEQIKQLPLEIDAKVEVDGEYHNVIEIRDRKAAVVESDCPGEDCVHSGWTGTPGRSIVCLPNRVEIRIVGMDSDVDFVVR